MKKFILLFFTSFYFAFGGIPVYDVANHRENIISRIESVKQTIEQIQHTKNQVEQLKNQFQQLENEAKNLKQIGKDLSSGNLNSIQAGLDKILYLDAQTRSRFFKAEDFLNEFDGLYRTNEQLSDSYKVSLANGIKENKRALNDVRRETSKVIFDSMKQASYNPTLNDKRNIEMLVSRANTTEGALQAIQAGNNILGQMALSLVEIRNIMSKSVVVASAVSEETRMTVQTEEIKNENYINTYKDLHKEEVKLINELNNKIKAKKTEVNWGGI